MSWLDTLEDIRTKDFTKAKEKDRDEAARNVINLCSYACAAVAVSPIPFSDAVVMLPVQSAMVVTIGHIYGRKVTKADAKDLIIELGATFGAGLLARQGIKALLPMIGALLTIPAAYAANWAIGRVAAEYFKVPGSSRDRLKQIYEEARREGKSMFSREGFERFRKNAAGAVPGKKKPAAKKKKSSTKARRAKKPAAETPAEG